MKRVLLLGAGKIGRMITKMLQDTGDYEVIVADHDPTALDRLRETRQVKTTQVDASDPTQLKSAMADVEIVVSALSFRFNPLVATCALDTNTSYFDLTEDVETTRAVRTIAAQAKPNQIFHATMRPCPWVYIDHCLPSGESIRLLGSGPHASWGATAISNRANEIQPDLVD